ncbi:Nucleoid-associated protein [Pseudobythopirellula maris]|uniref:Nucleoid-associated protein Mal64_24440 n=1 Tax=Pseudobythopirellula maris TaxID=2527991 RepID=A0A5C5ZN70_9BACT|nr:YbaB/EbfC family nucleoid-associated protein [Pseudobythopirellula maris]TWT88954.1 Nucleoid-associated protein [Pseudobythopirellula maris]
MLKGLGNLANIGQMMQQAKEMGSKMKAMQEELKAQKVTGSAGGGMVEVDANGAGEVLAVRIDPSLKEKGDMELVEGLLPAACNAAAQKARELHAEKMQEITGGMPGLGEAMAGLTGEE